MNIQLKLFAVAKQLAGRDSLALELPENAVIRDVRRALGEQVPPLRPLLASLAFAVNAEYALDDAPVPADADVACIPPVSGG
ncbi:MAG: MoaD/ThiS family protein [Planctomycetales bacterium]